MNICTHVRVYIRRLEQGVVVRCVYMISCASPHGIPSLLALRGEIGAVVPWGDTESTAESNLQHVVHSP